MLPSQIEAIRQIRERKAALIASFEKEDARTTELRLKALESVRLKNRMSKTLSRDGEPKANIDQTTPVGSLRLASTPLQSHYPQSLFANKASPHRLAHRKLSGSDDAPKKMSNNFVSY